jgi:hypothetical protein
MERLLITSRRGMNAAVGQPAKACTFRIIRGMPILHKSNLLLSKREIPHPFVGWMAVDEFEDLLSSLTGSRIVKARRPVRSGLVGKIKNRLAGSYPPIADVDGGDLLLVVARAPIDPPDAARYPGCAKEVSL